MKIPMLLIQLILRKYIYYSYSVDCRNAVGFIKFAGK